MTTKDEGGALHAMTCLATTARVTPEQAPRPFEGPLISIGASIGGVDALAQFLEACPPDLGAALVVVVPLAGDERLPSERLGRHTALPVVEVAGELPLQEGHVYLVAPGALMQVHQGWLRFATTPRPGFSLPIDVFFNSAAEVFGAHAVAVVLSGTGSDGTHGAVAINAAGGFLVAQRAETARFDGMPRSVLATGLVDAVLAPAEMPVRLQALLRERHQAQAPETAPRGQALEPLHRLLFEAGGVDFRAYKPAHVLQQVEQRMVARRTPTLAEYRALAQGDRDELLTLQRALLIAVTRFFRDPATFELLAQTAVRALVRSKAPDEPVRVWTAGGATGEEAYSLAMAFLEAFEREGRRVDLKIFATDVDPACVETGRGAHYPLSALSELSAERLHRFFTRSGEVMTVNKELRQCVVFARHNLLCDPPFRRMDLVVCRNTLIYFDAPAQARALRSLQYAVSPGGYLLLGPSESLGADPQGFRPVDARHKLFERVGHVEHVSSLQLVREAVPSMVARSALNRGPSPVVVRGNDEGAEANFDELQSINEELMATNAELQRTIEQLTLANAELGTVNQEYREHLAHLDRVNGELDGLSRGAGTATLVLDPRGHVARLSVEAAQVLGLRADDVGRPLEELTGELVYPDLGRDLAGVLQASQSSERAVAAVDGQRSVLVRLRPRDGGGAVASLVDITAFHDLRGFQRVLDALPEHVAVLDGQGIIRLVNEAWRRFARANGDPALARSGPGASYLDACRGPLGPEAPGEQGRDALRGLQGVLSGELPAFSMEYPCHAPTLLRWYRMRVAPLALADLRAVVSHLDISLQQHGRPQGGHA